MDDLPIEHGDLYMIYLLKIAIEIVDLSNKKTVIFHSYVSLPESSLS